MDAAAQAQIALIVAVVSATLTFCSFMVNLINSRRDSSRLTAEAAYSSGWEGLDPRVNIVLVNVGRRPVVLLTWVGATVARNWLGVRRCQDCTGSYLVGVEWVTLGERQSHVFTVVRGDLFHTDSEGNTFLHNEMWVEDVLRRRYKVNGSRDAFAALWQGEKSERSRRNG